MKRILCALLLVLALTLSLAACGKKQPTGDPSAQPPIEQPDGPDTPDTPAPPVLSEAEQSLADLREAIKAEGAALGCALLGSTYGSDAIDLRALLKENGWAARYPFLLDLPSELTVSTGGWEIYCIVPADEGASITVNEFGWPSWDAEEPVVGGVLWESRSGIPFCMAANVSDIMPDTQITLTAADGTSVTYQPFLSLRDGSLAVPEDGTVYDFTVYPEGFVRETTA